MKRTLGWLLVLTCGGWLQQAAAAQSAPVDPVQRALEDEVKRAMGVLTQKGNPPPYFLSYEVNEVKSADITASLGALQYSSVDRQRLLDIEVRVGDYNLDNTHQIRGQRGGGGEQQLNRPGSIPMPVDDDVDALKSVIWLETDRRYKSAVERFINVQANRAVRVEEENTAGDLSREKVEKSGLTPLRDASIDMAGWEKKMKTYSAMFKGIPELFDGRAGMTPQREQPVLREQRGHIGSSRDHSVQGLSGGHNPGRRRNGIPAIRIVRCTHRGGPSQRRNDPPDR
jgi:hypothetical protein